MNTRGALELLQRSTSVTPKRAALLLALVTLALDGWIVSLRCPSSPDIDWSRFAFGMVLQVAAVAIPLVVAHVFSDSKPRERFPAALVAALVVAASFPMVYASVLLPDTIGDKFFHSKGYACPGVTRI